MHACARFLCRGALARSGAYDGGRSKKCFVAAALMNSLHPRPLQLAMRDATHSRRASERHDTHHSPRSISREGITRAPDRSKRGHLHVDAPRISLRFSILRQDHPRTTRAHTFRSSAPPRPRPSTRALALLLVPWPGIFMRRTTVL